MKELKDFLHVVNNDGFVEGHEVLEDVWKIWKKIPEKRDESFILKGLINGSTAIALKVRKKDEQALRVWATYLKYEPLIDEIDSEFSSMYRQASELLVQKSIEYKIN